MKRGCGTAVPDRQVTHGDGEDDDGATEGQLIGEATPLPMDAPARSQARKRRERLDSLGGFGFQAGRA